MKIGIWVALALPLWLSAEDTALHDYIAKALAEKKIAGAVVVVEKAGKVVFREAAGMADIAAGKPMRLDALFHMASSTKPFSATTILTLVDQGKLRLDDPVSKYFPEFRGRSTVRQLLSHTSGIFGNDGPAEAMKWIRSFDLTVLASVAGILRQPLAYEPGTKYVYGGASFEVAAGIAEKLSGMDFETYMRKVLLDPLGLEDTCFRTKRDVSERVPRMYGLKDGVLTPMPTLADRSEKRGPRPDGFVLAAGGLYSTGDECIRLLRLHLNRGMWKGKRVLSEAMAKEMRTKQTGDLATNYGLGWNLHPDGAVGHGGAYGTDLWFHPQKDIAVAVMIQVPSGQARGFQQGLRKLVLR